ncbi:MAG: bifunctional phosphopantothenoylcysteine decarboxylase/phosphopantothenate--cysteine ligase CoaBC [Chloroflexi bacterium]|nr:bifunctional phosphopantothenoylcysteine decarboxylase/phosphopantothenate--cysteine ligase CoaBC [Chloroflexota bacterium]
MLQGKHIVLGVTGGIAVYKAADICSKLVQAGASVDVIMTEAALAFMTPLTFQTLTRRPVSNDLFKLLDSTDMAHISLAKKADLIVIAPATANTIAKLAQGLADNLLTTTVLASVAPLVLAPAMDADMWAHPATQANVATLAARGAVIIEPDQGRLASGRMGRGRLPSTEVVLGAVRQTLGRQGPLAGRRILVTAGGTQEPLDPVRHLTNRSSGRMGYALAEAARDAGATVTLISAPTGLPRIPGIEHVAVRTAGEMARAVLARTGQIDILMMAAAVADYRPAVTAMDKIKKADEELFLELERTEDILRSVASLPEGQRPRMVVGFAAETSNLLANASEKLSAKRLDLLVANDVSAADAGFDVATNRVVLLSQGAEPEALPLMSKFQVAEQIWLRVQRMWSERYG